MTRVVAAGSFAVLMVSALMATDACAGDVLTALEQAGRRLYLDGVNTVGEPMRALIGTGQLQLKGPAVACGNCHGPDGKGRPEATVIPPDITWETLTKPYGHAHDTRKHGPFDTASLSLAVNEGRDPAGNRLDVAMPRFSLSRSDLEALEAYLKLLSQARDPGVGERELAIGTILPADGPASETAKAVANVVSAYFNYVNAGGGVHQRSLKLNVATSPEDARTRFAAEPVFAMATPMGGQPGDEVSRYIDDARLPTVGPLTSVPDAMGGAHALAFYLQPGLDEQAAALLKFAADRKAEHGLKAAVLAPAEGRYADAANAAVRRCEEKRCGETIRIDWVPGGFDPAAIVRRLQAEQIRQLVFIGPEPDLGALVSALAADQGGSGATSLYLPANLVRGAFSARQSFAGELLVAFPSQPALSAAARPAWEALMEAGVVDPHHQTAQLAALQATAVLVEALRRAGRGLTREGLVRALESLSRFDSGFGPPVSFGPGHRIGARGSYIVAIDRDGRFRPASGWVELD